VLVILGLHVPDWAVPNECSSWNRWTNWTALSDNHFAPSQASSASRPRRALGRPVGGRVAENCAQEGVHSWLQLRHASSTPSGRYKFTKPLQRQRATMTTSLSNGREMLTAEEVHDITGVPVSTLHDWAAKRERGMQAPGPHHIRLSNRHRRWARKDVDQWIELARI
jgi:predicted DNA-binding transcriptional regulator AlpA